MIKFCSVSCIARAIKFYGYHFRVINVGKTSAVLYACHPHIESAPFKVLDSSICNRDYVNRIYKSLVKSI